MRTRELLEEAIESRKPIRFDYNKGDKVEGKRIGNPHVIYKDLITGDMRIDIYQTGGVTDSGVLPGWRPLFIEYIENVDVLHSEPSFDPAPGYNPDASQYKKAVHRL